MFFSGRNPKSNAALTKHTWSHQDLSNFVAGSSQESGRKTLKIFTKATPAEIQIVQLLSKLVSQCKELH